MSICKLLDIVKLGMRYHVVTIFQVDIQHFIILELLIVTYWLLCSNERQQQKQNNTIALEVGFYYDYFVCGKIKYQNGHVTCKCKSAVKPRLHFHYCNIIKFTLYYLFCLKRAILGDTFVSKTGAINMCQMRLTTNFE